jgi:hypothetical protein
MKLTSKIVSIFSLVTIAVISFFAGRMPLIEGYNPVNPTVDTYFSEKYDKELFQQIKIGDDTTSVINKIGHPYEIWEYDAGKQWNYSGDGKCEWADFAWLLCPLLGVASRYVVLNPSGGYVLLQAWTLAFSPTQVEPAPSEDTVY